MLVLATNAAADTHDPGSHHPERRDRTVAAHAGLGDAGLSEALVEVAPRPATAAELRLVHTPEHLLALERVCRDGGGALDPSTRVSEGSWPTALLAAGAGLQVIGALEAGLGAAGLVLVRPPGHHAGPGRAMGFCLFNNIAIAAAHLVEGGQRVAIVDWDVHHGNGTQEVFWEDPRVLFVSVHQRGLYPGTGWVDERGGPGAEGATLNIPLPAGTAGDALRHACDRLIAPSVERFAPDWVLVSAGFDGHRADPLANWRLTAADYAAIARRVAALAPRPGRLVLFLEGGYNPDALRMSVGAVGAALADVTYHPEEASVGAVGQDDVDAIAAWLAGSPSSVG